MAHHHTSQLAVIRKMHFEGQQAFGIVAETQKAKAIWSFLSHISSGIHSPHPSFRAVSLSVLDPTMAVAPRAIGVAPQNGNSSAPMIKSAMSIQLGPSCARTGLENHFRVRGRASTATSMRASKRSSNAWESVLWVAATQDLRALLALALLASECGRGCFSNLFMKADE